MAKLKLNTIQKVTLFNYLQSKQGVNPLWGLLEELHRTLKLKEHDKRIKEFREGARKQARALDIEQLELTHNKELSELEKAKRQLDVNDRRQALLEEMQQPAFLDVDEEAKEYEVHPLEVDRICALTADLRKEADEGAKVGAPCKECGRGGVTEGRDWRVWRPIMQALVQAQAGKEGKGKLRAVDEGAS